MVAMAKERVSENTGLRGRRFALTKFIAPRPASRVVARSRLFDELDRGAGVGLTLVVGAPGAGKTTLLANWLAARTNRSSAWLSCDAGDSDPVRFMAGLIEALQYGFDDLGVGENTASYSTSTATSQSMPSPHSPTTSTGSGTGSSR